MTVPTRATAEAYWRRRAVKAEAELREWRRAKTVLLNWCKRDEGISPADVVELLCHHQAPRLERGQQ